MSAPQIDLTFQACAKHGIPIERGAACAECVREDPAPGSVAWPEELAETTFSVRIHCDGGREIVGFNGSLSGALGWLVNEGAGQIAAGSPEGFYLVVADSDGSHSRCRVIAYETEDQRAERLAKGGA